jgi:hypothetical protein
MNLNLIDVNRYHTPSKNSLKHSSHNLSLEIYIYNFKLCDKYYFVTNIFHIFKFVNGFWNLKKIEYISKDNQIYLKQTKKIQDVMFRH